MFDPTVTAFFILLSGTFFKSNNQNFSSFLKFKFFSRLLPVYFYGLMVVVAAWLSPTVGSDHFSKILGLAPYMLIGLPLVSWPCWFLVGLFSSELCYYFIYNKIKSNQHKFIASILFCSLAWMVSRGLESIGGGVSMIGMVFLLQSVPLFCGLFFFGASIRSKLIRASRESKWKVLALFIVTALICWYSMNFNDFTPLDAKSFKTRYPSDGMFLSVGQYGYFIPFMISIYSGILAFCCFCILIPPFRILSMIGDHALLLIGINSIFVAFLNSYIAQIMPIDDHPTFVKYTLTFVVALATALMSLPLAILLEKYLPQLVGKPMLSGPLLPALYKKA